MTKDGLHFFGVTLIGATPENLRKILLTLMLIAGAMLIAWVLRSLLRLFVGSRSGTRFHFWARQAVSLLVAVIVFVGIASIWFDDPARLAGVLALVGAGVAFAMQRVITAVAGYFVILRGKTFNVGDRIVMGGVRGDVIGLSFMQTRIMEMGQSPAEQGDAPSMWIHSRQFTGRIVTVTNDKIFDEAVYNYTDQFPYLWDEIRLPIRYGADADRADAILIEAAKAHALTAERLGQEEARRLEDKYGIKVDDVAPRVYWRLTDNWLELALRFLIPDHGGRGIKDKMSRQIVADLGAAKIEVASATYEITSLPPLRIEDGPTLR